MSKPSLLVLGASLYQLDAIRTAQQLGYRVVTTDNVPHNPGHRVADRSYLIDTTKLKSVLEMARRERITGVIAPATDVAVPTAAFVAERMPLTGPPYKAAKTLVYKLAFRSFQEARGYPCPKFFVVEQGNFPAESTFRNGRWILKPDHSSGSKGIFIVASRDELELRWPQSRAFSPQGRGILEEYLDGHQGTCEGILRDGRIVRTVELDRQTLSSPYTATTGHIVPTSLPSPPMDCLREMIERMFADLGVTDAVFDCDFVLSNGTPYVLELTPRIGGNCIGSLLKQAAGIDITEYAVQLACGAEPTIPKRVEIEPMAVLILGSPRSGLLEYDADAAAEFSGTPWVERLTIDKAIGCEVETFTNSRHRIGECLIRGTSREDLMEKRETVLRRLAIDAQRPGHIRKTAAVLISGTSIGHSRPAPSVTNPKP